MTADFSSTSGEENARSSSTGGRQRSDLRPNHSGAKVPMKIDDDGRRQNACQPAAVQSYTPPTVK